MSKYTYNLSEITGFNNFIEPDYVYTPNTLNPSILKLNKTDSRTNNNTYSVIRYDKNLLCIDLIPSFGICRSIILNSANKIVSFAPPKSYHADYFIKKGGVAPERINVSGHADTKPVGPNDTSGNRAKNRRIEVIVSG